MRNINWLLPAVTIVLPAHAAITGPLSRAVGDAMGHRREDGVDRSVEVNISAETKWIPGWWPRTPDIWCNL